MADGTDSKSDSEFSQIEFVDGPTSVALEEEADTISVPEPATFGMIALGLAVAGGLLVRNRNDNFQISPLQR